MKADAGDQATIAANAQASIGADTASPLANRRTRRPSILVAMLVQLPALFGTVSPGLADARVPNTPTARPVYTYIITPTLDRSPRPGYPQIVRVELNARHFASHDEIVMQVETSPNVIRVTTHEAMGHGGTLVKAAPGIFRGSGRVAGIPFFIRQIGVNLHYTATTADGKTTTVTVPVHFKR